MLTPDEVTAMVRPHELPGEQADRGGVGLHGGQAVLDAGLDLLRAWDEIAESRHERIGTGLNSQGTNP